MDTFSERQSTTGHNHACSNTSCTQSVDSGVYVHMEINFDDSLPRNNLQEANEHKENTQTDIPNVNLQPEEQNNNGELTEKNLEKEQYKNYVARSDPDLVIGTAGGLKGSTSAVIPAVDNLKSMTSLSMMVSPPQLPPKCYQRSSAFQKTSDQGPDFNGDSKPMNSQMCQTSSLLCGVKGNNQCPDLTTGKTPDIHNSCIFETVPKVESKCSPQPSPKPPHKPPIKPLRLNKPKRAERDDGKEKRKQEAEESKHKDTVGDRGNKQEQDLSERKEKTEENEETSGKENHLDVGKPLRQILVIFTEKEKEGEDGQNRRKEDKDPREELTTVDMEENSTLLPQDEKPDMAATNGRSNASTISAKPEPMILAQLPTKPNRICRPVPPIKPPHLSSVMSATLKEQRESMKQEEEQWRDEDLLDKKRDEYDEDGNDRENGDPRDPEMTTATMTEMFSQVGETVMESIPKSSVNEEVDLPGERQRFSLMPHCSNSPTPVNTPENPTLRHQSQLPGTQQLNQEDGQFDPGPLPQEVPVRVNPIGLDSNMDTLRLTENNTDIQMSGQVISKLASEHLQVTEVVEMKFYACQQEDTEEIGETLVDGELRQTNQKSSAGKRVVKFAKKMLSKIKEGREEKRRLRVREVEMDDTEVTQVCFIYVILPSFKNVYFVRKSLHLCGMFGFTFSLSSCIRTMTLFYFPAKSNSTVSSTMNLLTVIPEFPL